MNKKFYITSAISYPNGAPHIGHAYEFVCADAIARFKRLDGFDVRFQIGTDVHGQKMWQTARHLGISVRQLSDQNSDVFQKMADIFSISYDRFIRTSDLDHHTASQSIWNTLMKNGDIYKNVYSGWYSVLDESYYEEHETYRDNNGIRFGLQDTPVEWIEEESYFFRLSSYGDKLLRFYEENPDFIAPKIRRNEIISFVKGGLKDLSISRTTFDWGIKVPGDQAHIMYVWLDALTNYITGVGYPYSDSPLWSYWPADVHIIGKDIIRFHAVYWPAFLMSAGIELPKKIYAHGHLLKNSQKISKSSRNGVDPIEMIDLYGVDPLRYFLLRNIRFGSDGNYTHEEIVNQTNAGLSNNFGNLAQRSLSMVFKSLDGKFSESGLPNLQDTILLELSDTMLSKCREQVDLYQPNVALDVIWSVLDETNRYFNEQAPWNLKKKDKERMGTVLYVTSEVVRQVAILSQAFLPDSATRCLDQLNIPRNERSFAHLGIKSRLSRDTIIEKPKGLFPRFLATVYD
ncbi:methionine--tRNA ligase [Candidatus Endowatersipora endosymbiont of Watersipora subatra]|uniref:methionine--tRNA ligase n=1 Tax=Candidatus Endowatersipora endosymbiont of Watersipora subatra TaxID=3077946 RepID=UPI00312C88C4